MRWSTALLVLIVTVLAPMSTATWSSASSMTAAPITNRMPLGAPAAVSGQTLTQVPGTPVPSSNEDLIYHHGPVMRTVRIYAIFWLPPAHYFELPGHGSDANFENVIEQFFRDVGGSPYYNILTQYYQDTHGAFGADGPIENSATLAGVYEDRTPVSPTDSADAVQAAVLRAIRAENWTADLNTLFYVFAPHDVVLHAIYHGFFVPDRQSGPIIYALFHPGDDCTDCSPTGQLATFPAPNGDTVAYFALSGVAHELFEAVTDPLSTGWYDSASASGEIADKCENLYGAGGVRNMAINGRPYFLQAQWSNAVHGCDIAFPPLPADTPTPTDTPEPTATATPRTSTKPKTKCKKGYHIVHGKCTKKRKPSIDARGSWGMLPSLLPE